MKLRTRLAAAAASAALVAGAGLAVAPSASANGLGDNSLANVLLADGNQFDRDWYDFDLVTEAALAVIGADTDNNSKVRLLTDGTVALTAFIPNDRAFQALAADLFGFQWWFKSEQQVFTKLATELGIGTIENVLLYHVVPGATVDKATAVTISGPVNTALDGAQIQKLRPINAFGGLLQLVDLDPDDVNPIAYKFDLNKGNKQIAHGISFVLRPGNL